MEVPYAGLLLAKGLERALIFRQRSGLSNGKIRQLWTTPTTTVGRPRLSRVKRHGSRGISPKVDAIDRPRLARASLTRNVLDVNSQKPGKIWIAQSGRSNRLGDGDCLRVARRMS